MLKTRTNVPMGSEKINLKGNQDYFYNSIFLTVFVFNVLSINSESKT